MAASLRAYLKGRPLLTNCITYGALYMGAEFSQQTLLRKVLPEKKQDYDLAMVGRYGVLGSTVFPTILYYWYKIISEIMSCEESVIFFTNLAYIPHIRQNHSRTQVTISRFLAKYIPSLRSMGDICKYK